MGRWWRAGVWAPLTVGLLLRLVAAASGHGWFAVDDYDFGVAQGSTWLADPSLPFTCEYRSPVISWTMWGLMRVATRLGVHDRAYLLQCCYAALGVYSALAIPGVYVLAQRRLGAAAARQAAWLMAAYTLLPRIATRALIEVVAMVPLVWGTVCLDRALAGRATRRFGYGLGAGLALGAATLFRFQIGILFGAAGLTIVAAAVLARRRLHAAALALGAPLAPAQPFGEPLAPAHPHGEPLAPALAALAGLGMGGLCTAAAQAGIDVALGRAPLSTPHAYLTFNLTFSHTFGTSPWYTFLLHFLAFTLPPATLWLLRPLGQALRRHAAVACLLVCFVAVHSAIAHKEDRFMFPALPLFFVPLGAALAQLAAGTAWQRRGQRLFWGLNALGLALATTSDAHRNLTVPLLQLARQQRPVTVAAVGFDTLPRYYAGPHADIAPMPDLGALASAVDDGMRPDYVMFRHPPAAAELARLQALPQLHCEAPVTYPGDFMDQVLIRVNRHNARRGATAMLACGSPQG